MVSLSGPKFGSTTSGIPGSLSARPFESTTSGIPGADVSEKNPWDMNKALEVGGHFAEGFGNIGAGYAAGKTAKTNTKLIKQQGREQFSDAMNVVKQSIGSYVAKMAGTGVVGQSQLDVERGAQVKGSRDAARLMFNANIEAANTQYAGKMAQTEAYASAGRSFIKGFGAM